MYLFFEPDSLRPSESPNEPSMSTLGVDNIVIKKSQSKNNFFYRGTGGEVNIVRIKCQQSCLTKQNCIWP